VSDPEFLFALELSDEASFDRMLTDIADAVFLHLGLTRRPSMAGRGRARRAGGAADAGKRPCTVRFAVRAAEIEIVVAHDGAAEWRTRRPLP
jgi:hypothetical protein